MRPRKSPHPVPGDPAYRDLVDDLSAVPNRLLRLPVVKAVTGFGTTKIYAMMKRSEFPRSARVDGVSVWSSREINAWIEERFQSRPQPPTTKVA